MKKIFLVSILALTFIFSMTTSQVNAQAGTHQSLAFIGDFIDQAGDMLIDQLPTPDSSSQPSTTGEGAQSGCTFNGQGEEKCKLENPIGATEVPALIKQVITVALGVIGSFTLLMLVWGGFQWLTSAGNPEKVSAGTQTMVWAVIGVMVVFASYVLLSTFLNIFVGG